MEVERDGKPMLWQVRAFVKLPQLVLAHKELAAKLDQLERKVGSLALFRQLDRQHRWQ